MLRFSSKPDPAFAAFLDAALEDEVEHVRDPHVSDEDARVNYSSQTRAIFDRQELLAELERLLESHRSPALYKIGDYHFLILYDVLQIHTHLHNDSLAFSGGVRRYGAVVLRKIDFDAVLDYYFFDTDFLFAPEILGSMDEKTKMVMDFADETWGVVHQMKPHAEELSLQEVSPDLLPVDPDIERMYEPGGDYPVELSEEVPR